MNIPHRKIEALTAFGYTVSEGTFPLYRGHAFRVLHGTPVLGLVDAKRGYRTHSLAQKLISQGHATMREYRRNGCIYHLYSRKLYAQLATRTFATPPASAGGDPDTASRSRFHPCQPGVSVPRNGSGKVAYFCDQLRIEKGCLPVKLYMGGPTSQPTLRYFVDKFPLFMRFSPSRPLPRGHVFLCRSGARNDHRICYSSRAIPAVLS